MSSDGEGPCACTKLAETAAAAGQRQRVLKEMHLVIAGGVTLGIHFAAWVWGLYHTSLPHSLLCMSSSPVLLAIGCLALRKPLSAGEH